MRRSRRPTSRAPADHPAAHYATAGPFSPFVEVGGTCLNLDLSDGAANVLARIRGVNPVAILNVSLEVNLMSELIFDQEWMEILTSIGSLPFVSTVSLGFRVPTPISMQAFAKLVDLTPATHVKLMGLQLSAARLSSDSKLSKQGQNMMSDLETSPVDCLVQAFQRSTNLESVHLCRYRPVMPTSHSDAGLNLDPLILAISKLPRCKVFHLERTDVFSQQQENKPVLWDMICHAPFETLKIGYQNCSLKLEQHIPKMAFPLSQNLRLRELIIQHNIDDASMEAMSHLLRTNQTLNKVALLRIFSSNFGELLAPALENNTTLQCLELNVMSMHRTVLHKNFASLAISLGNCNPLSALVTLKIDVPGARNISSLANDPFLKMLRNDNFVLETIVVNRNNVPLHEDVLFYLKLNRIGRDRLLRPREEDDISETGLLGDKNMPRRNLREEWVCTLIQNKDDVRVLHYFICRHPTILPPA